jgi:hypothetical protein
MSEAVKIALLTALANGLVTWGIVTTKMDWMRADIAKIEHRLELIEAKK